MSNTQIRIKLAEKEYTLKVKPGEEVTLKQAGKLLNEQIRQMQKRSGIWDKQDLLVMVAFDGLVQQLKQNGESEQHLDVINRLSSTVEQTLKGD